MSGDDSTGVDVSKLGYRRSTAPFLGYRRSVRRPSPHNATNVARRGWENRSEARRASSRLGGQ
jgi:hypothetical protein